MSEIKPNDSAPTEDSGEEKDWAEAKAFFDNLKTNKPRPPKPQYAVTIAVSSRTLFNMVAERKIYEEEGLEKYVAYQVEHEGEPLMPGAAFPFVKPEPEYAVTIAVSSPTLFNMVAKRKIYEEERLEKEPLMPGPAFPFVKALMQVNSRLRDLYPDSEELFDIVLMTNNHAQEVRLINSINHYDLTIERFCMTGGKSPIGKLKAYMTNLYLSKDSEKVTEAIEEGIAAATMFSSTRENELSDTQLRVAFDGDGVLFSDKSDNITREQGLEAFIAHEKKYENTPLAQGPLKCFLVALGKLQRKFYAKNERMTCPIRTFLVTARGAASSGNRVLKTLRSWGLEIDEAFFLEGRPKGPLLQKIKPHIFFDDQMSHIRGAEKLGTISAHVPYGKYHKEKPIEQPAKKE